jgi:hypothetical protein
MLEVAASLPARALHIDGTVTIRTMKCERDGFARRVAAADVQQFLSTLRPRLSKLHALFLGRIRLEP